MFKKKGKVLSLLLALVMLTTAVPVIPARKRIRARLQIRRRKASLMEKRRRTPRPKRKRHPAQRKQDPIFPRRLRWLCI